MRNAVMLGAASLLVAGAGIWAGPGWGSSSPGAGGEHRARPSDGKIAFTRVVTGTGTDQVFVMNADGSHQVQLTDIPEGAGTPAWSPDNKMIAFTSGGIVVMNHSGSRQTPVTTACGDPTWSPDGTRFACSAHSTILVVNADGSGLVDLTHGGHGFYDSSPDWSPDGTKIAYESATGGGVGVAVVNADGTDAHWAGCGICWSPAWSPDGTEIAYGSGPAGAARNVVPGMFVMNADGTGLTRISTTPGRNPSWSPDATRIAFQYGPDIRVVSIDGGDESVLTGGAAPAWEHPKPH